VRILGVRCVAQQVDPFVSFARPGISRLPTWADDIEADFQQWREEQNS